MKPAILIRLLIEIGVDVAVRLESAVKVAPEVDNVVAISVGEATQGFALGIAHDPGSCTPLVFRTNGAGGDFLLGWPIVVDILLNRRENKCIDG